MTIDELIMHIKESRQHSFLYHFTDESNFVTIREKGLVSKARMRAEGWWPIATGGYDLSQQLDEQCGVSHYISLCLTRNHPMQYVANQEGRLPSPKYLGIAPEVLKLPGVLFAFGIANANDTLIMNITDAIASMDLEVLYSRTDWRDPEVHSRLKAVEKMELLVPEHIPLELIKVIF